MVPGLRDARSAELRFLRYRPAKRCVFLWAFHRTTGPAALVSGTVLRAGEGEEIIGDDRYQELAEKTAARLGAPAYRFVPERRLLLQVFPLDAELPELLPAASPDWISENLTTALDQAPGVVHVRSVEPVNFKPWRRCALRYDVEVAGRVRHYFAKVLPAGRAQALLPRLRALAERLASEGALWDVPEALFCLAGAGALVFEAIEGTATKALLARTPFDPAAQKTLLRLARSAGLGLGRFQRAVLPGLPVRTPHCLLRDLSDNLQGLEQVAPALAAAVAKLIDRLETKAARLPPEPAVLGHASFRHTHFVLRGKKPVLLDLDGVCLCGPSLDPGNFLAYLDRAALRRPHWAPVLRECGQQFSDGLAHLSGLSVEWLAWHRAAAQVKGALRSFSSLSSRGSETTHGLIALAERILSQQHRTHEIPGVHAPKSDACPW
jgi:hypothetical protein